MKVKSKTQLKIKLKKEDGDNLKTALKKMLEEHKKIGFNKSFLNDDEQEVIQRLHDNLIN